MARYNRFLLLASFLFALSSCNVLSPFAANTSDQDRLEEAQECLHDADFDCALKNYDKLSDPKLRMQKMCMAYISKSGFTLSNLINTATSGEKDVLGKLAAGLLPHTDVRYAAAEEGKKICVDYSLAEPSLPLAILLRTMALFNHCATRIAKTDVFLGTGDADTVCTTPGNNNQKITADEISDNADGTVTSTGMCKADADTCRDDLVLINPALLKNAGLDDINKGYEALPAALKDPASPTNKIREALRLTLPAN